VAIACLVWAAGAAAGEDGPALVPGRTLKPAPSGEAARQQAPLYLRADELRGQPDSEVQALGNVELRQAGVVIRADQLRYDQAEDLAVAQGKVRVSFEGSAFTGPEVKLKLQRMQGVVLQPEYTFAMTGASGRPSHAVGRSNSAPPPRLKVGMTRDALELPSGMGSSV
jgi:LPS-assembly protein